MRDVFENRSPEDPREAVRRSARPGLRRRFYEKARAVATPESYAVQLDDKPVRTPAGRILAAPSQELAGAIAAEWEAQSGMIDPSRMPLTRLANVIIDGVCDQRGPVAAEVGKYLASDLVCYRANAPTGLADRQARAWDPILDWANNAIGAHFTVGEGVIHVPQPEAALAAARAEISDDPWRLGAIHAATTLTGSALIALALARGRLTAEEAWQAAHVDEDWNIEQWGADDTALERRALRYAEFKAAATVLGLS